MTPTKTEYIKVTMKNIHTLVGVILGLSSLSIEAAGFRKVQVVDPGHPDITVGIWYPSAQQPPEQPNTEFNLPVALDSRITETNGGLILISHGYGGWYAGHADTAAALADQGFVVLAPSHTGNTWSNMSSPIEQWALDRPRHISRIIDHALMDDRLKNHIDAEKIGVYGFSAGGYTALGLIGGIPDFDQAERHCSQQPEEFACVEGMVEQMLDANMHQLPDDAWGADSRIKAASISAPGFGFVYTNPSLASVTADVQLWSGQLDTSVPTQFNAASIAGNLPKPPETHWIEKANHFAFMTVSCREAFKKEDPEEYKMVCADADGFDRYEFHDQMHLEMARFFRASLNIDG